MQPPNQKPLPKIDGYDLNNELALIISRSGRMLWRSPAWSPPQCQPIADRDILGTQWLEHVEPDDCPALLAFFAQTKEDMHRFRFRCPRERQYCTIDMVKLPWDSHWLCLCAVEK